MTTVRRTLCTCRDEDHVCILALRAISKDPPICALKEHPIHIYTEQRAWRTIARGGSNVLMSDSRSACLGFGYVAVAAASADRSDKCGLRGYWYTLLLMRLALLRGYVYTVAVAKLLVTLLLLRGYWYTMLLWRGYC